MSLTSMEGEVLMKHQFLEFTLAIARIAWRLRIYAS